MTERSPVIASRLRREVNRRILFSLMDMNFHDYILFSLKRSRYYVGQTNNITERFKAHIKGYVNSTKSGYPWNLVLTIKVESRSEAMKREAELKKWTRAEKEVLIKVK